MNYATFRARHRSGEGDACRDTKPVLAVTAACVFGYIALTTNDEPTRVIASAIVVNAVLCHVYGCVEWDITCNAAFAMGVLATSARPRQLLSLALPVVLLWIVNDTCIDSCALHALCVQGAGAYLLLRWQRDSPPP